MEKKTGKIKRFFGHPFIQFLGPTGVLAVITWLITKAAQLPLWLIWLAIIFVIVFTLVGVNQVDTWKQRHKKGLMQLSRKELERTIREWVNIPAWSVQPQPLKEGTLFAYVVKHQDLHVAVVRQAAEPSVIGLASKLTMRSEKTTLSEAQWQRLAGQLSIEMARLGIEWDFVGSPNKYETIRLGEQVILDDAVTGYYFRSRIIFVIRAGILVWEIWKEALRLSEQSIPDKGCSQP